MRLSWITWWALSVITHILMKGSQSRQTPTEEKAQYKDRGKDQSNVAMSQGMPQPPVAERDKECILP